VAGVAPLAREAALPGRNFNVAARDRRFLSRLAVPPFMRHARPCAGHPRLPLTNPASKTWMAGSSPAVTKSDDRCALCPRPEFAAEFAPPAACLARRPRLELAPTAVTQITHHGAWRGGRVVECTALEMRHRCKPIGGSNPSLSASSTQQFSPVSDCSNLPQGDRRIPRFCVNSSRKL
jgi:hypothetical protein